MKTTVETIDLALLATVIGGANKGPVALDPVPADYRKVDPPFGYGRAQVPNACISNGKAIPPTNCWAQPDPNWSFSTTSGE